MIPSEKRRSAKAIIETYAIELMKRENDPDARAKLTALKHVAIKMGWFETEKRINIWLGFRRAGGL